MYKKKQKKPKCTRVLLMTSTWLNNGQKNPVLSKSESTFSPTTVC